MTQKSMLQIENCVLFGYGGGENPNFTMQHMLLCLCLGSSLHTVTPNVPQLFQYFIILSSSRLK